MQTIEDADIILTLFDSSDVANDDDKKILNLVENESENKHIIYVLNKIDLENKFDKSVLPKNCNIVEISAQNNIDILTKKLEETINIDEGKYDDTVLVSNMQMQSVTDTVDELKQALMTFDDGNLEFFAFHINESLKYISNITRPYEYSNMLDVMFGEFCLGK
jgi:tRNA modification GTPase